MLYILNVILSLFMLNPYYKHLPCCHTWIKLVLILSDFVLLSSLSQYLLLAVWWWLTILDTGGKPWASLLIRMLLWPTIVMICFAKGHKWLHHTYITSLGCLRQHLTIPAAHHSVESTLAMEGTKKFLHLLHSLEITTQGYTAAVCFCWSMQVSRGGRCWFMCVNIHNKLHPPAGWMLAGVWTRPLSHLW